MLQIEANFAFLCFNCYASKTCILKTFCIEFGKRNKEIGTVFEGLSLVRFFDILTVTGLEPTFPLKLIVYIDIIFLSIKQQFQLHLVIL